MLMGVLVVSVLISSFVVSVVVLALVVLVLVDMFLVLVVVVVTLVEVEYILVTFRSMVITITGDLHQWSLVLFRIWYATNVANLAIFVEIALR